MRKVILPLLCCLPLVGLAQKVHDWQVNYQNNVISLDYKGKTVISTIALGGYKTNYSGARFNLNDAVLTHDGETFTWKKKTDQADATLTLVCQPKKVSIDLLIDAQPDGPFEFGFHIPVKNFVNEGEVLYPRLGRNFFPIQEGNEFANRGGKSITFEQPEIIHTFTNIGSGNYMLQDWRKRMSGNIRYIAVYQVNTPTTIHAQLEWTVEDGFDEEALKLRRRQLAQPIVRYKKVEISNNGFEDGFSKWDKQNNTTIDETVSHSGKASAKITVNDPKTDNVYITRHVPVIGGANYTAECFVKTLDVMAADGRMPSVGAGLIVEWADKNHKWIAAGVYDCDKYGTKDWTKCFCQNLRAPDDAGYAAVFLALRGKGTAWFDDFAMTLVERSVDKLDPELGAVLDTNAPKFSWFNLIGATNYTLELSQSEDFAEGTVHSYTLEAETEFQVTDALQPGIWHWRVNAPGCPDIQPWTIKLTAAIDRDCLPPVIHSKARRLFNANDPLVIEISENSGVQPVVTATAPETSTIKVTSLPKKDGNFVFSLLPENGWKRGFSTIAVTAIDKTGNKATKAVWLICAPAPENAVVIDKDGCYSQNGKRIFPFGIYEVVKPDMLEVRQAGFDVIHTYRWEGDQDDVECRKYLDDCWAADHLRAFIGFDRGNGSGNGIVQGNFEHVARRVGAHCDHPALFCWYLFDEPEVPGQYVSPKLLTEFAELVRQLDPYHPVVMTTWGSGMNRYRRTWDTHWTQAYQKPDGVVRQLAEHRRFLNNDSPITLLVHSYDKDQHSALRTGRIKQADLNAFKPDYDWMRAAAFVGIVKDVNGLWWWWFARRAGGNWMAVGTVDIGWKNLQKVVAEIAALRPVLNAVAPTKSGTVTVGKSNIEWWSKTVDGKTTFIAVNTSEEPVTATIPLPDGPKELSFKRYEVKVFQK
ncbi:MAG: hypothetical protein IKP58_05575 [Victivallales bacterium]|nr:hypothetical protein [Victivallales bacterium]